MSTLFDLLRRRATHDPAAPYVSWYGPGSTRAELSGVTFATSVAKTAGMLTDDLDLEPGATIRLLLPLHWQLPVWVAAADLAGLTVLWDPCFERPQHKSRASENGADVTVCAETPPVPEGPPELVEGLVEGLVVVSAATPFGRPQQPVAAPLVDHFTAAMGQPDVYLRVPAAGQWIVSGDPWTADDILARARGFTGTVAPGGRVLVAPGTPPLRAALVSWAVPLITGGSCVLVQSGDEQHIATVEHAQVVGEP